MHLTRPISIFLLTLWMVSSHAKADDRLLEGLLVNNTITWFGRDFFSEFARHWRNQSVRVSENLIIEERPSARRGSELSITFRDTVVFRSSISGSRSQSRSLAARSVPVVSARIRAQLSGAPYNSSDLAAAEF